MSTYEKLADLPLAIDSHTLEGRELAFSPEFSRLTTLVRLRGDGHEGVGEDVTYDGLDHVALQAEGGSLPLAGSYTLDSFSKRLAELDLWPSEAVREQSRDYRRWAFESAALDLALRQAGLSLAEAVGRDPRPINFVVSMRLGEWGSDEPETADRLMKLLERYPSTRFKLDPANSWTEELVGELAATRAVDIFDLKGFYRGTPVDVETDPALYRMVAEAVPSAWLEDADVTDETLPVLEPIHERLTWDAPIHSVEDVRGLRWKPRMINIKPSRFGTVERLLDTYDHCEREGIGCYGGGQTELGEGRGQIQYLASIFHPETPNDTAPAAYNNPKLGEGLPTSPLEPRLAAAGFRWEFG
jgi:L-alanine-DL-glutamate epimerase-like enolase superfamily enzyme